MKITLQAKPLAAALGLAAGMADAATKRIAALGHAHLATEGDQPRHHRQRAGLRAEAFRAGDDRGYRRSRDRSERLAALAAGFPGDAEITISSDDTMASIVCGRSRFKLPTLPIGDLPSTPTIEQETGRIEIGA